MDDWASELERLDTDELFRSANEATLRRFTGGERFVERLSAIVGDERVTARGRVNAAEILARKRATAFPPPGSAASLARAYAAELKAVEEANPWSMPGQLDGALGQHLVALGKPAVAALVPLLDDGRVLVYGGSKETMEGERWKWRVKDLAATFIARIAGKAAPAALDPKARDREIATLRSAL